MTCIAAIVEGNKIWMGSDRLIAYGSAKFITDTKIVIKDNIILGFAGRARDINLIRFGFDIPPQDKKMDDYEYVATILTSAIRERLKNNGAAKIRDQEESSGLGALIGYKGSLYLLSQDFCVVRVEEYNYHAAGTGGFHAMGSLYSTHNTGMNPRERILLALNAAENFISSVEGPFVIESLEF